MNIIEHLESYLGQIDYGWKGDNEIQAIRFKNQPFEKVTTYTTLGMSNIILSLLNGKNIRQELLFSAYNNFPSEEIASFLITFGTHILETGKGLLRGEVIGPGSPLIKNTSSVGVYASVPVFFEDSFYVIHDYEPPILFVWLIPLMLPEIHFIKEEGWEKFEETLEISKCDFWNLNRKSLFP